MTGRAAVIGGKYGRKSTRTPQRGTAMHALLALAGIGLATLLSFALALLLETMIMNVMFWGMRRTLHRTSRAHGCSINDRMASSENHQQEVACLPS